MKRLYQAAGIVAGLALVAVVAIALLTPWMDRWGATGAEIAAAYPGDDFVPAPTGIVNHALTIQAAPEQIFPWILQLGAGRGGMYSYSWFETYVLQCELVNAESIHPEWQDLKVGDPVRMCPGDFGPPPYIVSMIEPERVLVMGHKEGDAWVDQWQFILEPQGGGGTRLILRTRTMATGGFWDVIHPGIFVMERGMLLGIKERAERTARP